MSDLDKTWRDKNISQSTKMRLYRALILPIVLYGCETWTLGQVEEKKLLVFEMAALRKIAGVRRIDKIRNDDIRARLNCIKTIVQVVYQRQHRWLGHVLRFDRKRIATTVLQGKVEGVRRRGKPRATWTSEVERRENLSLHQAGVIAQDRAKWKELEEIVGAHVRPTRLKR